MSRLIAIMRRAGLALFSLALVSATPPVDEPSALERDPDGWIDLLAGAGPDLKGWTRMPIPPAPKGQLNPDSQWSIDSGTLVCSGEKGHEMLLYDRELGDFLYHVEWRFIPLAGKQGYNSGIYARNSQDGTIWHQAQTGDGSGGFLFGDTRVHGQIQRVNLAKDVTAQRVKPAGEWNTYEITCRGKDMTLWVNGAVTCDWHDCEVPTGFVGIEAEGWRIAFRNVKLKPLGPD